MDQITPEELEQRGRHVAEKFGGILPAFEAFYVESILYSSNIANDAFNRYEYSVSNLDNEEVIFSYAQEALTHVGSLSRFFWPSRKKGVAHARGEKLRTAFGVSEESVLKTRELRNSLEHFDERLDEFLLQDPTGMFFPGATVGDHSIADQSPGQIFRLIDPVAEVFVILGKKHDFAGVRSEVARVLELAKAMIANGSRLKAPR